jgi:hypothetical protein
VLTQTTKPGWGAWVVENDATTLFEMWGAFDGKANGVASHNHVMFSTFMPWLYQVVAGIAMDDGDFGVDVLPPSLSPLTYALGDVPSWLPTVRVSFFRQFTLEDAIESHACSLEASRRVTNGLPSGCPLFLPVHTCKLRPNTEGLLDVQSGTMLSCFARNISLSEAAVWMHTCRWLEAKIRLVPPCLSGIVWILLLLLVMTPANYATILKAPKLFAGVDSAAATVVSLRGVIAVSWLHVADEVWVNVTLPVGADTPVTVPLPAGCFAPLAVVRESGSTGTANSSSRDNSTIGSVGGLVWSRGTYIHGVSGVVNATAAPPAAWDPPNSLAGVVVTCGSGSYMFAASCKQQLQQ